MSRALRLPGLLVVAAAMAVTGWLLMCTTFMIHDDEGYVLLSLRNFSEHGRLYDDVFTQYGPVPFLYYHWLHRLLDLPIAQLLGRVVTTVHWLGAALGAALIAWRLSGRYWTAVFTLVTVFAYLWQMTWEPSHPGGLIAVATAISLAGALAAWWRDRRRLALALLGATGAILFFTKINVGLLWCCSVGAFLLLESDRGRPGRGAWLAAAGMVVLPFALMRPLLGETWVANLAILCALSGAALCLPVHSQAPLALKVRDWLAAAAGFAGTGAIIVVAALAHGTSAAGLWRGVVLDPLRHPVNFHFGFTWDNSTWVLLTIALIPCALWCLRPQWRAALRDLTAILRLLFFAGFISRLQNWGMMESWGELIHHGLPLLPLFVLPLRDAPAGDHSPTAVRLTALIAAGQVLHTYPVSGTQMAWGSFLLMPVLVTGLTEATAYLAQRWQRAWLPAATAGIALLAAGGQSWTLYNLGWERWQHAERLELPGAEFLRPPENIRYALRIAAANARLQADVLFSRPGMFGFNLWTGLPTPTLRNATHWFWLLSAEEQQAIISRLQAADRPVVISSRPLLDLLRDVKVGVTVAGPLNDYLVHNYRTLFTVTGYDFMVPVGSPAVPFFVAQNFRPMTTTDGPAMVAVNIDAHAEITRIVLRDVRAPDQPLASWDRRNSQVTLQSIDVHGHPAGEPRVTPWPLRFDGLQQMRLYHRSPLPGDRPELELVFLDANGQTVFEACYDLDATVALLPAKG